MEFPKMPMMKFYDRVEQAWADDEVLVVKLRDGHVHYFDASMMEREKTLVHRPRELECGAEV